MTSKKVVILGGGVAGMSVAHELLSRNDRGVHFEVEVYEGEPLLAGGKARSIPVPDSGTNGRPDLPGEHGFRFFPGFYRHLPDTMRGIPYRGRRTVFDNLVPVSRIELARSGKSSIVACARFPRTLGDLETMCQEMLGVAHLDLKPGELAFFAARIWQIMTSCEDRRLDEYEKISWWQYLEADRFSRAYRHLLANGLSRSLLANNPRHANARTVGDTNVQLLLGLAQWGGDADRVLAGPTSETWLDPWLAHLKGQACRYHFGCEVRRLLCDDGRIAGAAIHDGTTERVVTGDYYVGCVPVERMAQLIDASRTADDGGLLALDPTLDGILALAKNVAWMNGIQFFLYRNVDVVAGHTLYVDSPWSLTSISEAQFWSELDVGTTGDGTVHGVLSVCISDWNAKGVFGKRAKHCTRDEIAAEVWEQLKQSLNVDGKVVLEDADRHSWFLDPDICDDPEERRAHFHDLEPLLVNFVNTWTLRPDAFTRIPNLLLAADYVRTNTDVACMEAANEAARRAVNCILEATGSRASWCEVWKLQEPLLLAPFRAHDQSRYDRGLPWSGTLF